MKRTGRPRSSAQMSARHSGEKDAKGKKLASPGSSAACIRRASGGRMSGSAAKGSISLASLGPSISTAAGSSRSSAATRLAAEPGP